MDLDWDKYKADQKKQREENHAQAMATFDSAKELARVNGWTLAKHTEWHFSLSSENYRYNLYPSNQRIYADPKHRGPFLKVSKPWTFLEVVSSAIIKSQVAPIQKGMEKSKWH